MNSLLTDIPTASNYTAAHRLQQDMAAVRLSFRWLGTQKTLTAAQRAEAAENFGAEGDFLSAAKKLLDTTHPAYRAVTVIKGKMVGLWKLSSVPFPEPGIRLIPRDRIAGFDRQMTDLRDELYAAVTELDEHYAEMKQAARRRLGRLFNEGDYPATLVGSFAAEWDFPSISPPDYLRSLSPVLYEQECLRIQSRFAEAVELAEAAFTEEFGKLVSHLCERLAGGDDGRPKVFRDSAVANLVEFFDRFRSLNVRSSDQLDSLVEQAHRIVQGVAPQELRDSTQLRQHVATELSRVQAGLDQMLVDRPRRRILRSSMPARREE